MLQKDWETISFFVCPYYNSSMRNCFVFIGRSGCGKGTQVELLEKYLKEKNPERALLSYGSGKYFREFVEGQTYTQKLAKEVNDRGALQPEFLAVSFWSRFFVETLTGDEDVILDGAPRKLDEARMLDSAFGFYGTNVHVIFVNVSREWATAHLLARGRADDTKEDIERRLTWFDTEVMPTVEFYRNHPEHVFVEVRGEQPIEDVHKEIISKIPMNKFQ